MFHKAVIASVVGLSCVAVIAAQPGEDAFRPLAKNHRWFELRDTANARTSPLVRGALAAAFNDPATAERLLRGVIRDEPRSDQADDAYALLAYVYLRTGQYERFATLYQAWAAALPQSANVREEHENFEKYRGRPNQANGPRRRSVVRHDADGYLTLPIAIDGKRGDFLFDTRATGPTAAQPNSAGHCLRRARGRIWSSIVVGSCFAPRSSARRSLPRSIQGPTVVT